MTVVDIVILVILVVGILDGLRRGFVVEVASLLGALVAFTVARAAYPTVRAFLETVAAKSAWLTVISYLVVFLAVWGAIVIGARVTRRVMRMLFLGCADRVGGGVLGLLHGVLVVEMLLYLGKRVPDGQIRHAVNHSALGPTFVNVLPFLHGLFPHVTR